MSVNKIMKQTMFGIKKLLQSQLTYSQYQHYARISCWSWHCQAANATDPERVSKLRQRCRDGRHVLDVETAAKLAQAILEHREDAMAPILHVEAGPGLVCREFLKKGVTSVIALESTKNFMADHKWLEEEYGSERFQYVQWQMLSLRLKLGMAGDREGSGKSFYSRAEAKVSELLQEKSKPGSSHAILNIGSKVKHEHHDFMFYILRNMPNDDPILSRPGVEFFFFAHPRLKAKLEFLANIEKATYSTRYAATLVAAYLLYDIKFIGEFDAKAFVPAFKTTKSVQDPDWVDPSVRLLVKFNLKKDIEAILPMDHHVHFFIFLQQLYMKKINRLIPTMEMLVPGSGIRMLVLDFTMMDIIIRTKPEKLLLLYKHMIEWPEYQSSPLRNYILQKTRGGGIDLWADNDKDEKMQQ